MLFSTSCSHLTRPLLPTTKPQVIHSKTIVCLVLLGGGGGVGWEGGPSLLNRQYCSHCESATSHKRTL